MSNFRDKVAIITGGASGIGRALAEALARDGAEVVVADVNAAGAVSVAESITAAGGKARAETLDVRDAAAFDALAKSVAARSGRIDYLFNNAGIAVNGEVRDISLEDWKQVIDVDLHGVIHGVAAVYPIMVRQGSGHIVNTASVAGLVPSPTIVSYATAKHGVVGLSRSLRAEGADLGVNVSVVCPGFIDTAILRSRGVGIDVDAVRKNLPVSPLSAEECARQVLRGVAKNRSIIVVTWQAKLGWLLSRAIPSSVEWIATNAVRKMRRFRTAGGAGEGNKE